MIDTALNFPLNYDDVAAMYEKQAEFADFFQIHVFCKLSLAEDYTDIFNEKIEASIKMCQQYDLKDKFNKIIEDLNDWIAKNKVLADNAKAKVIKENTIFGPLLAALRIFGWIVIAPALAIEDGCFGTNNYNDYNNKIVEQCKKTPWSVAFALCGILGLCVGGIGSVAVIGGSIMHLGLCLTLSCVSAYAYKQACVEYIENNNKNCIENKKKEVEETTNAEILIFKAINNEECAAEMKETAESDKEMRRRMNKENEEKQKSDAATGVEKKKSCKLAFKICSTI
jgi:hypothetical protein